MSLEIREEDASILSSPTKTALTVTPTTSCPSTPSSTRKRGYISSPTLPPSKKQAKASPQPDPSQSLPYDFWVTVWFKGERTANVATVRTHTILAAFKVTGYVTTCHIMPSAGLSKVYTDDHLWLKVTMDYPPSKAVDLLGSPIVTTNQSVVLFTQFPCPTSSIALKELEYLFERHTKLSLVSNEITAHPIIPGGRPFTWSRSKLIELTLSIQDNKTRRVDNPTIHVLQEAMEIIESMDTHVDE
ncbi:hypothetical protein AGABI2DRAFT_123499 [Agaricus bisporus var. bisporus H97]|uniref:hypothetical protein n=1 Tax=Agaricus bisporus var. bisporus (strain H97 / ATCC MYA-4626 / FGSC 10389) TaxID=936046 RepID=UPI00029F520C|nr:hypothetical protein AGABI2DRAFT_123499 [Agaricus bisporus var. bisporus H97]EKV41648.1 hypothetical protein AGABI2DRAFT_123499 [Agaricus bisporus var. bisporus H97]